MLMHYLAKAHFSYKKATFVAAKGHLSCNGKPARNAKVSIVAHASKKGNNCSDLFYHEQFFVFGDLF